jgi:hypothetical protein
VREASVGAAAWSGHANQTIAEAAKTNATSSGAVRELQSQRELPD